MTFQVAHDSFSGPLGLLLELLDQNKLEIKDVSLAQIADQYLAYLDSHEVPSDELADFLLIASRLIYLKTKGLMPYLRIEEEEENVAGLEEQLRLYRLFMEAAGKIESRYEGNDKMFVRPFVKFQSEQSPRFVEPTGVTAALLREAFGWVQKRLEPFFALQETSMERVKSVEERIGELTQAIKTRASLKFREVISGARSKAEVVVSFLALLELVRRQVVKASQHRGEDIAIERLAA